MRAGSQSDSLRTEIARRSSFCRDCKRFPTRNEDEDSNKHDFEELQRPLGVGGGLQSGMYLDGGDTLCDVRDDEKILGNRSGMI